jgi:hypothetical protein
MSQTTRNTPTQASLAGGGIATSPDRAARHRGLCTRHGLLLDRQPACTLDVTQAAAAVAAGAGQHDANSPRTEVAQERFVETAEEAWDVLAAEYDFGG